MKNFFTIFVLIFVLICCGCSTKTNYTSASTIDEAVCYDLQNTENIETYSDETKKALSVIYRTNHKIKNDYQNQKYTNLNQELLDITKSTSNETLSLKNNTLFEINKNNYLWTKKIKKSQLLNFLYKNNISVANISKVSTIIDKENNVSKIDIGGKLIDFDIFSKEFNLESKNIKNIETNKNDFVVYGEGKNNIKNINLETIEGFSKKGINYKKILESIVE